MPGFTAQFAKACKNEVFSFGCTARLSGHASENLPGSAENHFACFSCSMVSLVVQGVLLLRLSLLQLGLT